MFAWVIVLTYISFLSLTTSQLLTPSVKISILDAQFIANATTTLQIELFDVDIASLVLDSTLTSVSNDLDLVDLTMTLLPPSEYSRELLIRGYNTHQNTVLCQDIYGISWFGLEYLPSRQKFQSIITNRDYFVEMYNEQTSFNMKRSGKKDQAWTLHCPMILSMTPNPPTKDLFQALQLPPAIFPVIHLAVNSRDELNRVLTLQYAFPLEITPLNALPPHLIPSRSELPSLQPNEALVEITDLTISPLSFPHFPPNTHQLAFTFFTNINGVFHIDFNAHQSPNELNFELFQHDLIHPWCRSESDDTFGQLFGYPLSTIDFTHITQSLASTRYDINDPTSLTPAIYFNQFKSLSPRKITCTLSIRTLPTTNMSQRRFSAFSLRYERSAVLVSSKSFSLDRAYKPVYYSTISLSPHGLQLNVQFRFADIPNSDVAITLPDGLKARLLQDLPANQTTILNSPHCTHFTSTLTTPSQHIITLSNLAFTSNFTQSYTNDDISPIISCSFTFFPIPAPKFIPDPTTHIPTPPPFVTNDTATRYNYQHAHQFQQAPLAILLFIDNIPYYNAETNKPQSKMKLLTYPIIHQPTVAYKTYELPRYRALSTIYEYQFSLLDLYGKYHMVSTLPVLSLRFSCPDDLSKVDAVQKHYCPYSPFEDAIPFTCMSTRPTSKHQSPVYFQTPKQHTPSPLASESYQQKPKMIPLFVSNGDFDETEIGLQTEPDQLTRAELLQSMKIAAEMTQIADLPPTFTLDREFFPLHMDYEPTSRTWNADLFFLSNILDYNIDVICTRTVIEDWIFGFNPRVPLTLHLATTELPERHFISPDRFHTVQVQEPPTSVPTQFPRWHKIPKSLPTLHPTLRIQTGLQLIDPAISLPFLNSTLIRHEIKRIEHILSSIFESKFPITSIAIPQFNDQTILDTYQPYFNLTKILAPIPLLTQPPNDDKRIMPYFHDSVRYSASNQPLDTTSFSIHPLSLPRISPFNQIRPNANSTQRYYPSRLITGPLHRPNQRDLQYIPTRFREHLLATTYPWEYISLGTMETTLRQTSRDGNNAIPRRDYDEIVSSLNSAFYTNIELQYLLQAPLSSDQINRLEQLLSYTLYTYFTNLLDDQIAYVNFGNHQIHLRSQYDRLARVQPMLAFLNTTGSSKQQIQGHLDPAQPPTSARPNFLLSAQSIYRTIPESNTACGIYPNSAYFVTNSSLPIDKDNLAYHTKHSLRFKLCSFYERCDFHHDCDQSQGLHCEKHRCQLAPRRTNIIKPKAG